MFTFKIMNQTEALEVANHWNYDSPYDFYNMKNDIDDYKELIEEKNRDNYYSVYAGDIFFGFYCFTIDSTEVEIGLGINPKYVSQGLGEKFVNACIAFTNYPDRTFTLAVVSFNRRAITVYERCGFVEESRFMNHTNGGQYEFIKMTKRI